MGTKVYDNALDLITFTRASGGTYLDSDGLLKTATNNIPRIEYAADGTLKGLLIEEQRTNLVTDSNDLTAASYVIGLTDSVTVTANQAVGPDGEATLDRIDITDTTNEVHHIRDDITTTSAATYATSIVMKADEQQYVALVCLTGSEDFYLVVFDLVAGAATATDVGTSSGSIVGYGVDDLGGGLYRCWMAGSVNGTGAQFRIMPCNSATPTFDNFGQIAYAGTAGDGFFAGAFQVELGSFPTSYIPTSGATATRSADIASIPVTDFGYNAAAGTLVMQATSLSGELGERIVSMSDGTATNQLWVQFGSTLANVYTGGAYQAQMGTGSTSSLNAAVAFKDNSFAAANDGAIEGTDTTGTIAAYTDMHIGRRHDGLASTILNGHIKSIQYYPRRLSNAQLQELTT